MFAWVGIGADRISDRQAGTAPRRRCAGRPARPGAGHAALLLRNCLGRRYRGACDPVPAQASAAAAACITDTVTSTALKAVKIVIRIFISQNIGAFVAERICFASCACVLESSAPVFWR